MAELFADLPEALANSVEIAQRCSFQLALGQPRLPDFQVPEGKGAAGSPPGAGSQRAPESGDGVDDGPDRWARRVRGTP